MTFQTKRIIIFGYNTQQQNQRHELSDFAQLMPFFNHSADTAIDQIKRKEYPAKIADYTGDILLVGINYDKETKQHTCKIESNYSIGMCGFY